MAAGDGLVSMTPTSIAHSGTSATINADGGVDFTAVTELSLNGVFTSDYDNYLIVFAADVSGTGGAHDLRFRVGGVDNSTASSYVYQLLDVSSTSIAGTRSTTNSGRLIAGIGSTLGFGFQTHVYGPALAQPTAYRSVNVTDGGLAQIPEYAGTHNQSTAYDGFTIFVGGGRSDTGSIHVFGYEE